MEIEKYAKQKSVEFLQWQRDGLWFEEADSDLPNMWSNMNDDREVNTGELYDIFLKETQGNDN